MGCSLSNLVFQPPSGKLKSPVFSLYLQTSDGNSIPARYFNLGKEFTMLMSHGNAEDITRMEDWVEKVFISRVAVNVMLYEYTGYDDQAFEPSEKFVYSDSEAALWFLTKCMCIPLNKIILYGRSLGSGPSCYLAEKYPVGGLILHTPLSSIFRVVLEFKFTIPGDMFPNIDRMKKVQAPLLVIHGTKDEIVPMEHAFQLFDACKSQKKLAFYVEGAGHNNIESVAGITLFETIQNFVNCLSE
jgi:abhydrolase domain-containing protein 17